MTTQPATYALPPPPELSQSAVLKALRDLLRETLSDPTGVISASPYDTALIVRQQQRHADLLPATLAQAGLDTLLRTQNSDGSWGSAYVPANYRLVPTLAAVAALLELSADGTLAVEGHRSVAAVRRGLTFLVDDTARFDTETLPDFVAIELIVPALLEDILRALVEGKTARPARLVDLPDETRRGYKKGIDEALQIQGVNRGKLHAVREAVGQGKSFPEGLIFSLEVIGQAPEGWDVEKHFVDGAVACSPALTATALGWCGKPLPKAISYLTQVGERHSGAWPNAAPAMAYERAWVVGALARLGISIPSGMARQLAASLAASLGPRGAPFAPGLPPDGDDSSAVLFALYALDEYHDPGCLLAYEADRCFASYIGEKNASVTTNAHILEAFAAALEWKPPKAKLYRSASVKAASYLLETQQPDGTWDDKWHASPYYSTLCAAVSLAKLEGSSHPAVQRAIQWVLATQRDDGSWGRWNGTLQETAYALHILLFTDSRHDTPAVGAAVRGARQFLINNLDAKPGDSTRPPLWHCKDLFEPDKVERAYVLSALYGCTRY